MRIVRRASAAMVIVLMMTGCAPGNQTTAVKSPTTARATSSSSLSPEQICQTHFKTELLLDWTPATLAGFRTYQYGGPKNHRPFAHLFPALQGSTPGAWCGTNAGHNSTHWWAVVVDQKPASLWISGPDGVRHGLVTGPPQVP